MIEVPLDASPEQFFTSTIEGLAYDFRVVLSSRTGIWSMNIASDGVDLVLGVPLLSGVNILEQHNLPISNMFVVPLGDIILDPTKLNLGTLSKLFILNDEELESLESPGGSS